MKDELRALGIAHALVLALVLAAPFITPELLPWCIEALFIAAAFQLRLADRRRESRAGLYRWTSHIRMAPARLICWTGMAVTAMIAGPRQAALALSILTALLIGELIVYPLAASLLGRLPRRGLAASVILLLAGCGLGAPGDIARLATAFALGLAGGLFWLRGPDGEARSLIAAAAGAACAMLAIALFPLSVPFAFPAATLCSTLAFAHLSVIRRSPLHWRVSGGPHRFEGRPADPA